MTRFERGVRLWRLALPIAASQVSDMVTVGIDTIMVGKLGTTELAAVSLATASSTLVLLFGIGFNIAITPQLASAWAAGDLGQCKAIVRTGTRISLLVACSLVVSLLLASPFLNILGSPQDVTEAAIPYFRWYVASFLFRLMFGVFKQSSEALGNTKLPMYIAVITNLLNILFNWLLIWGIAGLPALGVEGAGFATFLSRVVGVGLAYWAWNWFSLYQPLRNVSAATSGIAEISARIWKSGSAIGAQISMEVLAFATGGIMIGWIGTTELAAHQIALNIASITFMIALALASAATVTVAQARGAHDQDGVRTEAYTALWAVVGFELSTALVLLFGRSLLPALYVDDQKTIEIAATLLLYAAVFQIFDGLQTVGMGILRGINDTKLPTAIAFCAYTIVALPLGYVLSTRTRLQEEGVWVGYVAALVLAGIGYVLRIHDKTKKGQVNYHPPLAVVLCTERLTDADRA